MCQEFVSAESKGKTSSKRQACLPANLVAFLSRFLALMRDPKCFAPIIIDCWLRIQSMWDRRQSGPDLVYPLLGIKKRQSGHLARLILEHSRDQKSHELRATRDFPEAIDPPCVAVIDLDQVHLRAKYSTSADMYGIAALVVLSEVIFALVMHVLYDLTAGDFTVNISYALLVCVIACRDGDGVVTLARGLETSTSGCAVFLDQGFTLVLKGNQAVVEAVAQSGFNWPSSYFPPVQDSTSVLEASCEGVYIAVWVLLCYLLFPSSTANIMALLIRIIATMLDFPHPSPAIFPFRVVPPWSVVFYYQAADTSISLLLHIVPCMLYTLLLHSKSKARNYPIQSAKFLDAIGHPPVRKWQFNTLAAAATFQCLVLCHRIDRPVRNIDVLAFLDMLVPDETQLWRVWKRRVADRIVHEDVIFFTPTIPMFRDERQQQLVDILDEAQFGYDQYRELYVWGAPLDPRATEDVSLTFYGRLWAPVRHLLSSASIIERSPIYDAYKEQLFKN